MLTINQFNSMVINLGILGEFGRQVRREYVCKVNILVRDFCKSLFGNQANNLRFTGSVNIKLKQGKAGQRIRTD